MTIRTLHLINGLGTGGAERSLAELLPDLPDHGIEPHVVVFHRRTEGVEDQVRAGGVTVEHVDATGWTARVRAVRASVARIRPDLVHTSIFEADVVGRLACMGTGVPVLTSLVNTSYGPGRLDDPNVRRWKLRAAQAIDAASIRVVDSHFHAITEVVAADAVARLHIDRGRVTVVHRGRRRARLGVRSAERRHAVRSRLGLPEEADVIVHVGRQEHQKAHDVLLRAMQPVLAGDPGVHLVLAGRTGNATTAITHHLGALPAAQTHVLGHVDDVPDLLAAADVFVFPSRYEGLGGSALEAMGLGCPIVASDLPALHEFLDGVACFAPVGDADSLRAQVLAVLADPAGAAARAAKGIVRFDGGFEHRHIVEQMAALFARTATSSE